MTCSSYARVSTVLEMMIERIFLTLLSSGYDVAFHSKLYELETACGLDTLLA